MDWKYYYIPDDNAFVRVSGAPDYVMELYSSGQWIENYEYGGIYSGDIACKPITEEWFDAYK